MMAVARPDALFMHCLPAFHDRNNNGRLDKSMGIPREGFAFSRNPPLRMRPATFDEARRADLITSLWEGLGYPCQRDEVGNVMTRIEPGGAAGQPALAVMAHLDTVFSLETDVTVRQDRDRYTGPGVGDNSASLAAVTAFLRDLRGWSAVPVIMSSILL